MHAEVNDYSGAGVCLSACVCVRLCLGEDPACEIRRLLNSLSTCPPLTILHLSLFVVDCRSGAARACAKKLRSYLLDSAQPRPAAPAAAALSIHREVPLIRAAGRWKRMANYFLRSCRT